MDYISAAIRGNIQEVVDLSIECVMCGLCAARCPAEISPFNVALFIRRLYGTHNLPKSPQLEQRLKDIENGAFAAEIKQLKVTDTKKMQADFNELQANKGASV
jgi:heterodisulfide reductase subunit C